ncbi:MAG: hypothetical protein LBV43_06160 [Prevotella sp.]|jgi:tetratricopeptide (TPR) repeat protein|nr:hypothetical protein [Prevotella sp.]
MYKKILTLIFLFSYLTGYAQELTEESKTRAESLAAMALGKDSEGGSIKEVSAIFEEAIKIAPSYTELYTVWSFIIMKHAEKDKKTELYQDSFNKLEKALELNPDSPEIYSLWAGGLLSYANLKEDENIYNESFEKLQKAIELNPEFADAYLMWASALLNLANKNKNADYYRQSGEKYNEVLKLNPNSIEALTGKGWSYFRLGHLENDYPKYRHQVIESYGEAERIGSQSAAYNLACYYSLLKEKDESIKWLEKTIVKKYDVRMEILTKERIEKDDDFKNIRRDRRYKEILNRYFP